MAIAVRDDINDRTIKNKERRDAGRHVAQTSFRLVAMSSGDQQSAVPKPLPWKTRMARTREFDMDVVLDQAMGVFWRRGYAATSMADIYDATGLKPGSVYAALKSKEVLFQRAFERYAEHFRATLPTALVGVAAITAWLRVQADLAIADPDRRGCLIINTVLEREVHSAATQAMAQGRLQEIRAFFARHLLLARERGELAAQLDVEAQADALLAAVMAIMALGRAGADDTTIRNVANAATAALLAAGGQSATAPAASIQL